ncbi:TetR/AcrR family transcriptional regulator [Diplocloster modestus]|uniref:TetR/AcrR family transcriptional regulator n=1 Tax=Diplocloster modestus TaxID=2850322 RepID=A0ABS6K8A7_9FIRM|nr:TetR/AcrR family transcriptional regulator [Diplocloster modestus]MBU9726756.1 TetR/AcrR family transcriptional regulator [Diplocloster modestus]
MGKIEDKKKQKKEALFHTSFDLFTTKGFSKTSIADIVEKAGVAKGTFYLYFKDKYDIRNRLITNKAGKVFENAYYALERTELTDFTERLLFIIDDIIDQLTRDSKLLSFIAKNLSWGVFKSALVQQEEETNLDFYALYLKMIEDSAHKFRNPEVMLFMIVELVSGSCYNAILFKEPMAIDEYKSYLYEAIRSMIQTQMIK